MKLSRRDALFATLFGAGGLALRTMATGLPASILLNPRKALADPMTCASADKAQFIVLSTSYGGDPVNANVPGSYLDPKIVHPLDPSMAPTPLTLSGKSYTAAKPWASLPQSVLDRTMFFHMATGTPVHPKEPEVLHLMGAAKNADGQADMLPSLLAQATYPCLGAVLPQPISFGGDNPTETLTYKGAVMPTIPAYALRDTLVNSTSTLTNFQTLRDQTMNQIYDIYRNAATPAQRDFIDKMSTSQQQARNLDKNLLAQLATIKQTDNSLPAQLLAAQIAIQMKLCPVISVHANFGGDNHGDDNLQGETNGTVASLAAIGAFLQALATVGIQDKVTFMSLNVFGRTLGPGNENGRSHNSNHQVSFCIGKPFRGGVVGGCVPVTHDYGASNIDSSTGAGSASGDIQASDTLAAFGKTMLAAVGGDPSLVTGGKVVNAALT